MHPGKAEWSKKVADSRKEFLHSSSSCTMNKKKKGEELNGSTLKT
jgi:hypothetical protein